MPSLMPVRVQEDDCVNGAEVTHTGPGKQAVGFLKALGLTEYESKALCSLFTHSDITAAEVSRFSDIPVTKVYSVLDSLEGKGLLRYTPSRPKKYRPSEPQAVLDSLMKKQEERLSVIRECRDNVTALLEKLYSGGKEFISAREKVWVAPTEDATLHALARLLNQAKINTYSIADCDTWYKLFADSEIMHAAYGKAMRGVKTHVMFPLSIISNIKLEKFSKEWVEYLASEKTNVRALHDSKVYHMAIVADDRYVGFSFKDPKTKGTCNGITIDDPSIAVGVRDYLKMLWDSAQPIEDKVREMARKTLEEGKAKQKRA